MDAQIVHLATTALRAQLTTQRTHVPVVPIVKPDSPLLFAHKALTMTIFSEEVSLIVDHVLTGMNALK